MNVAKWLLFSFSALPILELAAFVAVAAAIGFGWALTLVLASSIAGLLILRHGGGGHVARIRVALGEGNLTAMQADGSGSLVLLAGILLLIPGFITDVVAVILLVAPLRRFLFAALGINVSPARNDGVVDLAPEHWHQIPDPSLPNPQRKQEREQ